MDDDMNKFRHLYLYSKGWYKRSENKIDDLKILVGNYSGTKPEHVDLKDINIVLYYAIEPLIENLNNMYTNLLLLNFFNTVEMDGFIEACFRFMRVSSMDVTGGLGEPDYTLLPVAEKEI